MDRSGFHEDREMKGYKYKKSQKALAHLNSEETMAVMYKYGLRFCVQVLERPYLGLFIQKFSAKDLVISEMSKKQ